MLSDEIAVQRTRWHLAAFKVELKLLRLKLTVSAYNPGQPRVPAGRPDGGQWTDEVHLGGLGADDDARLISVGGADDQRYKVNLLAEEGRGHAIREHVGKSDAELFERVQKSRRRSLVANGGMRRNGGFASLQAANDLVNQTIEANKAVVDRVASGKKIAKL